MKTILVVDDETGVQQVVKLALEQKGYHILLASDGKEAAKLLEKTPPHLIILDINMPKMGGIAFYHDHIASRTDGRPRFPVLVLTGRGELRETFEDLKIDGFISKPFELHALAEEVKRILAARYGQQAAPPAVKSPKELKILIAEDEDGMFENLSQSLSEDGFIIKRVKKIDDLPIYAKTMDPDLIFLKIANSSLNGPEFFIASRLRGMFFPKIVPVIAYTAGACTTKEDVVNTLLNSSGVHSLIWNSHPEPLLQAARKVLSAGV